MNRQNMTVGRVTLPYSQISNGWIAPDRKVIKTPDEAQSVAIKLNEHLSSRWEKYEKEFVMLVAGEMPLSEIAEKLERNKEDVRSMGNSLGVRFDLEHYRKPKIKGGRSE